MIPVPYSKLDPKASPPLYAGEGDAGADLYSLEDVILAPGQRALVGTGLALAIPSGYYGRIAPRSGLAVKQGLDILAGVVDSSYRGEVCVLVINLGQNVITVTAGQKIAQLVITPVTQGYFYESDLDNTTRGTGGFGSTGS